MNTTEQLTNPATCRWMAMAITYFVIAIGLGVFMGATHDHRLMGVHAHLALLGWVSMLLIGLVYHFFPQQGASKAGKAHFWLHQIALPGMMIPLGLFLLGNQAAGDYIGPFSLMMLVSVLLFAGNILPALRQTNRIPQQTAAPAARA